MPREVKEALVVAKEQVLGRSDEESEEEDGEWKKGGKFGTSGATWFPISTESE